MVVCPPVSLRYIREILFLLQMICKTCSRVLLADEQRDMYTRRMRSLDDRLKKAALLKKIHAECRKNEKIECVHCGAANGPVKKCPGLFKLTHDRFKNKRSVGFLALTVARFFLPFSHCAGWVWFCAGAGQGRLRGRI